MIEPVRLITLMWCLTMNSKLNGCDDKQPKHLTRLIEYIISGGLSPTSDLSFIQFTEMICGLLLCQTLIPIEVKLSCGELPKPIRELESGLAYMYCHRAFVSLGLD